MLVKELMDLLIAPVGVLEQTVMELLLEMAMKRLRRSRLRLCAVMK